MAHNLAEINGKVAMYVVGGVEAAWHHLGQRTENAVNWETAMQLAGLNWDVILRPVFARNPLGTVVQLPANGVFRSTDGANLGVVGTDYQPIQNKYAFDFVDSLLEAENGAHYESAGALGNGERIWCLARVPNADFNVLGTDPHQMYVLFTTSHDGTMSASAKLTDVRVVCQNTLTSALAGSGAVARVRHTKNAERRMEQCKRMMQGVAQDAKSLADKLNLLAQRKLTRESLTSVLDRLFPKPAPNQNQTRRENLIGDVLALYESNDNNAIVEVRGTAYNLLNAVTQYTDHKRTARITEDRAAAGYTLDKARAENALFGTGETLKSAALATLIELTSDAASVNASTSVAVATSADDIVTPELQADIDASIADLDASL